MGFIWQRDYKSGTADGTRSPDELLHEKVDEWETLLRTLPLGVYIAHDAACTHISMNPAGASLLRLPEDANASKTGPDAEKLKFRVLKHGVEIAERDLPMQRAARNGEVVTGEQLEVDFGDGTTTSLFEVAAPLFDAAGNPRGCIAVFVDVSERKRQEAEIAARTRRLGALYELTEKLQKATSTAETYEAALDSIQAALGCDRASLLLFDGAGVMRFVAWRRLSERYRTAVEGHSPWTADEANPRPFGVDDVTTVTRIGDELRASVLAEGIRAMAFVPLMSGGKLMGKFMVYSNRPHVFDGDELELAQTFGRQIAVALQRRRMEDEREQVAEALRTRARQQQAVARLGEFALRERDLQKVLDYGAALVARTLGVEFCKVLEMLPSNSEMLLRAGVGWKEGLVGQAKIAAGLDSQAGYALISDVPVIVTDLRAERRFHGPSFLTEHGVVSGMSCIIRETHGAAWGVIGAHSTRLTNFTEDDVSFLVAVTNILSNAIQRERADRALQEADRRKDEFLATLSHELRNPLAPLRNSLHVLRLSGESSGTAATIHEMMERQVNHLVRLVDDLLEVSRISRGTFALRREPVEVAAIVRNAVETSDPLIQGAGHKLRVTLPVEPIWLEGDPVRLAQILSNLLNNAARYTNAGGNIVVEGRVERSEVVIAVRDDGVGIAPETLPRIFEMFNRGDRPSGETGLGIGLALARRVAEMHGGTVTARSDGLGQGSEFAVRLPAAALAQARADDSHSVQATAAQRRVLIVDDNREAAESLGMLLTFLGADVRVIHDGATAIETFGSYEPALVLLDIGMPGMDGYEVARQLRRRYPERTALVVALTGWGQEEDRRRAREAGFDHHLIKPADLGTLQRLLASLDTPDEAVRVG